VNPPKMDPARGTRGRGVLVLPAEGRKGRTPAWPLGDSPTAMERALWRDLWKTPQAVEWERLGWTRVVARYARAVISAETNMEPTVMSEARQLEDRLGLTPKAMRLLLWTISVDEVAQKRVETSVGARKRIRAVS
jgi:hypothetical protein